MGEEKSMSDLISVIVPVYKTEKYLNKCLESIVNQTYKNLEIILIDDGSPDNCPQMCDEWARKDSRIKVIHKRNEGVAVARNVALDIAVGDYIGFCDSDDYMHPQFFEIMFNVLGKNDAEISVCGWDCELLAENSYIIDDIKTLVFDGGLSLCELLKNSRFENFSCNKLFKVELFKDVRYPAGIKHLEDVAIIYKLLLRAKKVVYVDERLYHYENNLDSAWHTSDLITDIYAFDVLLKRFDDLSNLNWFNQIKPWLLSELCVWAFNIWSKFKLMGCCDAFEKNGVAKCEKFLEEHLHAQLKDWHYRGNNKRLLIKLYLYTYSKEVCAIVLKLWHFLRSSRICK